MADPLFELLKGRRTNKRLPFRQTRRDELARVPYEQREGSGGGGHADLLKMLQGAYEFTPAADVGDVGTAIQDPSLMNVGIAGLAMLGGPPGDFAKKLLKAKKAAAARKLPAKPASENIWDVANANFLYPGESYANKMIPIDKLKGGTVGTGSDPARVKKLVEDMSGPEGYIERIITDDAGNVIEGQHRLDALRALGIKDIPVSEITDLSRGHNVENMMAAVKKAGAPRPEQARGIVKHALQILADEGGDTAKALEYTIEGWDRPFRAAIEAIVPQR